MNSKKIKFGNNPNLQKKLWDAKNSKLVYCQDTGKFKKKEFKHDYTGLNFLHELKNCSHDMKNSILDKSKKYSKN